jgi:glycosyltransferase involved in cell wall biosynthesis
MISVICPVFNEAKYIEDVLQFFINSEPKEKELILVDGGSTDNTVKIIEKWKEKYDNIFLLFNDHKYVPFALNLAIKQSNGDPIIRLDAHTVYQNDYFETILQTFKATSADIVGGPMRATGRTSFQKSVAYCTSTSFGIGNSKIHNENFSGYTDHVYLGAWRRNIFSDIGYFNEELKRNQDDEFHYRAKSLGKKIYLNSEIKSFYYPRSSPVSLIKQYFQYGLFKPLVLKKVKSEIKFRHLIPSAFILYLIAIFFLSEIKIIFIPLLLYFALQIWFSIANNLGFNEKLFALIVYPILHLSYGAGFLSGLTKLPKVKG